MNKLNHEKLEEYVKKQIGKLNDEANRLLLECYKGDTDGEIYLKIRLIHVALSDWIHHMNAKHVDEKLVDLADKIMERVRKENIKHAGFPKC